MREIKFEIMFLIHGADFEQRIAKHYTTLDRLTDGRDTMNYDDIEIIAKRLFTGLQDKNGVDIYEGDIVTGDYGNLDVDYSTSSAVEWGLTYDSDGWACGSTLGWITTNGSSLFDLVDNKGCEIIGNIHENKDLLNES